MGKFKMKVTYKWAEVGMIYAVEEREIVLN